MYDPNSLGSMFHLKALEAQAVPKFRSPRPVRTIAGIGTFASALVAFLVYFDAR